MLKSLFQSRRQQHATQRAVALLLLSLCFFDLAIVDWLKPELCSEGAIAYFPTHDAQTPSEFDTLPASHENESSDCDEDCFCCCAHVLPSAHFSFPALATLPERIAERMHLPLVAPPTTLFRPPRLA